MKKREKKLWLSKETREKKLRLSRETLRPIATGDLSEVIGMDPPDDQSAGPCQKPFPLISFVYGGDGI